MRLRVTLTSYNDPLIVVGCVVLVIVVLSCLVVGVGQGQVVVITGVHIT